MSKVIATTFAGRQDRMTILLEYIKIAIEQGIIDEYHIWNYARNLNDSQYLSEIAEIYSTPANLNQTIKPNIVLHRREHLVLQIRGNLEIYMRFNSYNQSESLQINITNQEMTVIKYSQKQEKETFRKSLKQTILTPAHFSELILINQDLQFKIQFNDEILLNLKLVHNFEWEQFEISSRSRTDWIFDHQDTKIKLFTCRQLAPHWEEYYDYYGNHTQYHDDLFLKISDDIVYLDLLQLRNFIQFRRDHPEYFLLSTNLINDNYCLKLQQQHKLFPVTVFPQNSHKQLLEDTEKMHQYFIHHLNKFQIDPTEPIKQMIHIIKYGQKFPINFVSWLGKDWKYLKDFGYYQDDQMIKIPKKLKRSNVIYLPMIASHLSTYGQEPQMYLSDLIRQYHTLQKSLKKSLN